jgi:ABC-type transport system involved in Fe-S cluster assembly fused permease/ATPase subunit
VLCSKICNVIAPVYLASATDGLSNHQYGGVARDVTIFGLLGFASKAFKELQSMVYISVSQAAFVEMSEYAFVHLHTLPLDWHLKKKLGSVTRYIDRGIQSSQSMMTYLVLYLIPTIGECFAVCVVFAAHFNARAIAIFVFLLLALYAYATVALTLWRKKFREGTTKHDNELHEQFTDSLVNWCEVKYFGNEDYEREKYMKSVVAFQKYSMGTQFSLSTLNVVQQVIIAATLIGALLLSLPKVEAGELSVGQFIAIQAYIINLYAPLNFLGTIYTMVVNSVVDMRNFASLLAEKPAIVDEPNAPKLACAEYTIEYDAVSFRYKGQPEERSLRDVSFHIAHGRTLGIVGTTGAGKSTLSRLLFRLYDPFRGTVKIGGIDISSVTQSSVRAVLGIVPQDTCMFNDTIAHNLRYGRLDATMDEVVMAAKAARLDGFIEQLDAKYETMVGERGLKLSGGEKQRLAIARCLLKNPPIVVFDEATSSLDTETEAQVLNSLKCLRQRRTTLVITHRMHAAMDCDEVLVLEEGQVVEHGPPHELLAKAGSTSRAFAALVRRSEREDSATEATRDDDDALLQ